MARKEKKGTPKAKIDPLELNKETVENLTETDSEHAKGGLAKPPPVAVKVTDVRSGNKCCSTPCTPPPRTVGCR